MPHHEISSGSRSSKGGLLPSRSNDGLTGAPPTSGFTLWPSCIFLLPISAGPKVKSFVLIPFLPLFQSSLLAVCQAGTPTNQTMSSLISGEPDAAAPPDKSTGRVEHAPGVTNGSSAKQEPRFGTSMITSKFLSHPQDIGVVAVGFSGGQVRLPSFPFPSFPIFRSGI
jgi:hypothetical protein